MRTVANLVQDDAPKTPASNSGPGPLLAGAPFSQSSIESASLDGRQQIGVPVNHTMLNKFHGPGGPNYTKVA